MKKNKENIKRSKAFTLIELLATIAILGVISTVVIVSVINVKKKTDDTASKVSVVNIKTMAKTYATEYSLDWGKYSDTDTNTYTCVSIQELINFGYFKQKSFEGKSQEELYKYYILTKNNNTKVITSVEEVTDDTTIKNCDIVAKNILDAPKIVNDNIEQYTNTIKVKFNNSTRSRNGNIVEKDITNVEYSCIIGEDVSNPTGNECLFSNLKDNKNYTIKVCATSGEEKNICTQLENIKTKEIQDTTINKESNLIIKLKYNTEGIYKEDESKRYFKSPNNAKINNEVYACDGQPTSDNINIACKDDGTTVIEKNTWYLVKNDENVITIDNSDSTIIENIIINAFLSDGTNAKENSLTHIIKFPTTPTITGGSSTWSKVNKTITIFTKSTSETGISNYEYYLSTLSTTQTGGSWISFGTNTSFNVEKEGTYYVFVRAKDKDNLYSKVSNNQIVKIDKKSPTCSSVSGASTSYAYGSRKITVYCSDTLSACKKSSYSKTFTPTTSNITTGTITIYDNANNYTNCSVNVYLKVSPPTAPIITGGSSTWSKPSKTITISRASTSLNGLSNYEYYISTSSTTQSGGNWTSIGTNTSFSVSTAGTNYVFVRAKDIYGLYSPVSNYQLVKIDDSKPQISIVPYYSFSYLSNASVTLTLSDSYSGLSARQYVYYAWSTSAYYEPSSFSYVRTSNTAGATSTTVSIPVYSTSSLDGIYYLWIKTGTVSDIVGNTSNYTKSSVFYFDNSAPTGSLKVTSNAEINVVPGTYKYNSPFYNSFDVTVSGVNLQDLGSGIRYYCILKNTSNFDNNYNNCYWQTYYGSLSYNDYVNFYNTYYTLFLMDGLGKISEPMNYRYYAHSICDLIWIMGNNSNYYDYTSNYYYQNQLLYYNNVMANIINSYYYRWNVEIESRWRWGREYWLVTNKYQYFTLYSINGTLYNGYDSYCDDWGYCTSCYDPYY